MCILTILPKVGEVIFNNTEKQYQEREGKKGGGEEERRERIGGMQ